MFPKTLIIEPHSITKKKVVESSHLGPGTYNVQTKKAPIILINNWHAFGTGTKRMPEFDH